MSIYQMIKEEKKRDEISEVLGTCKKSKIAQLWKIVFETDIAEKEILENRIYEFGSMIKEDDVWGRDIFVCLVAFLNLVIK